MASRELRDPQTKRARVLVTLVALAVGVAVGTSFVPGAGTLLANTSYVAGGTGAGSGCPVPAGWSSYPPPAPSTGFAAGGMAYDYTDGYVVYFGGYTGSGYLGATWEYSGGCWKELGNPLSPSPDARSEFAMSWDGADNEVILFGGADSGGGAGSSSCLSTNSYYFYMCGDTWGFSGGAWHIICNNGDGTGVGGSSCATSPPPMNSPMMAYDPVSSDCNQGGVSGATLGCVFLVGGLYCASACNAAGEVDNDNHIVWEFFGNAWHKSTLGTIGASFPTARDSGGLTYDASSDAYLLLYGGENTSCASGSCTYTGGGCVKDSAMSLYCDDAWSLVGGSWTEQCEGHADFAGHTDGACYPPGNEGNDLAYDGDEGYVVDFGGFNGKSAYCDSDTHGYVGEGFTWTGAGSGGGDWSTSCLGSGGTPGVYRFAAAMVYDPGLQDNYLIVLGGANAAGYYATQYVYK